MNFIKKLYKDIIIYVKNKDRCTRENEEWYCTRKKIMKIHAL